MRAARTPWATPEQSAAIYRWADTYGCRMCDNTGWKSPARIWWGVLRSALDHFQETGHFRFK